MPELDDQQLLREFAETRSETAFATLVGRHINLVYSTALRFTGNPHHAEDIAQAAFIILARKAGSLGKNVVLSGWLYQTTRLTAANAVRSEMSRQRREQGAYMQSRLNEPEPEAWEKIGPLLEDAMGQLGETDRNAVILHFFEHKTAREVAATLRITEAAARKRMTRALEKLRRFFSRRGATLAATAIAGAISANSVHAAPAGLTQTVSTMALAKGAAAGGSTATLVKGALKIMASTKAKTAIAVTATALLAAGTTTVVIRDVYPIQEPTYAGRSLTEWLGDSGNFYSPRGPQQAAAEDAIRHIGTSALPFLVNDLIWDPKLRRHRLHAVRPDTRSPDNRCVQAIRGFEILGSLAKPAIPDLVKLLEQNPGYVPIALAGIGRDAVPELERALTNSDFFVRDNTAAGLANAVSAGRIPATDLEDIIPLVAKNVAYTNADTLYEVNTRHRAAGLLGAIHLAPEISVTALAGGLQDSHITVAIQCADALDHFGAEGKIAIPELIKAVTSTNSQLSGAACSALSFIDPDTLAGNVFWQTIALTTNADVGVQMQTIQALGRLGPKASEAIPALITTLGDGNDVIRMVAAQNLGAIRQQPDLCVPALSRALNDRSQIVRVAAIDALGQFGWKAREAVPTLLAMAKSDAMVKGNVQTALEKIDRNAAATLK